MSFLFAVLIGMSIGFSLIGSKIKIIIMALTGG